MATRLDQIAARLARIEATKAAPTVYFWAGPEAEAEIATLPPETRVVVYRWAEKGEATLPDTPEPEVRRPAWR